MLKKGVNTKIRFKLAFIDLLLKDIKKHYLLLFFTNINKNNEVKLRIIAKINVPTADILSQIRPAIKPPGNATIPIAV